MRRILPVVFATLLLPFFAFAASCSPTPLSCPVGQSLEYGPAAGCSSFSYFCEIRQGNSGATLSLGASGAAVRSLQERLITLDYLAAGNDTGYFGTLTRAAVQSFQRAEGIVSSGDESSTGFGLVGPKTEAALERASAPASTSEASASTTNPNEPLIQSLLAQLRVLEAKIAELMGQSATTTPPTPTPEPLPPLAAPCAFNGQSISSGESVTAYQSSSVPAGSQCVSQTRTCTDGVLSGSYAYGSCSPASVTVTPSSVSLPTSNPAFPECAASAVYAHLDTCLNALIEAAGPSGTTIHLPSGNLTLTDSIFIYNRNHITIEGQGKNVTKVTYVPPIDCSRVSPTTPEASIESCFTVSIIDANNIALENFSLIGPSLTTENAAVRGIAVCPVGNTAMHDITVSGLYANNFQENGFMKVGDTFGSNFAGGIALSNRPGPVRLKQAIAADPSQAECTGSVSNVAFTNNTVDMYGPAFYTGPATSLITKNETVTEANWPSVADSISNKWTGFVISGNTLTAKGDDALGASVNSAMKLQYLDGAEIENNVISDGGHANAFSGGAPINLAFGMKNTLVEGNTITLAGGLSPNDEGGVDIESAVQGHPDYGLGTDTVSVPAVIDGKSQNVWEDMAPPVRSTTITGNTFTNSYVRVYDLCTSQFSAYCSDLDANQSAGNPKNDAIVASNNTLNHVLNNPQLVFLVSSVGNPSHLPQRTNVSIAQPSNPPDTVTPSSVSLPTSNPAFPECAASAVYAHLDTCLNALIEAAGPSGTTIHLPSGNLTLTDSIFIYNRNHITIEGQGPSKGPHAVAAPTIVTYVPPVDCSRMNLTTPSESIESCFTVSVVDSDYVNLENFSLIGPPLTSAGAAAVRGIAICPMGTTAMHNITVNDLYGNDFQNWFTIVGDATAGDFSPGDILSNRPGPARLKQAIAADPKQGECTGSVSDVSFTNNTVDMYAVAFYTAPAAASDTAGMLVSAANWPSVADSISNKWTGFVISGNTLTAEGDGGNYTGAPYPNLHSGMKVQYLSGAKIEDNTISDGGHLKAFYGGAAINLAFGDKNTTVSGNTITYTAGRAASLLGAIDIPAYIQTHTAFGLGTGVITPTVRGTTITGNTFTNGYVRIDDVCGSAFASYCADLDANQTAGNPKNDDISVSGNWLNGKENDPNLVYLVSDNTHGDTIVGTARKDVSITQPGVSNADAERKQDLADIAAALEKYYSAHGTYVVSGTGANGGGDGWAAAENGAEYKVSLTQALFDDGYLSRSIVQTSPNYMMYTCNGGRSFALSATLDDPTAADIATIESSCNGTGPNGTYTHYGKNYAVTGGVSGPSALSSEANLAASIVAIQQTLENIKALLGL